MALPALESFLAENVGKEMRKDGALIERAGEAHRAGRRPEPAVAQALLASARDVDREFLARTAGFPVRIEIPYASIEPVRLQRIELGLQTAWDVFELWRNATGLRRGLGAGELERRVARLLELYAEETQGLSRSVTLPAILAPVRDRLAHRLREEMTRVARALARDVASRKPVRRG